jgi:hypothetical protein
MVTVYRTASGYSDKASVGMGGKTGCIGGFYRFLPKLKHMRVFGNIIESMRTDAFLYKIA